eukprot:CAMPEP_0114548986 /NCGR_PEP_ID=MMETSP0114-20121206/5281_1 /TAXON_ID=31324 /ORGANISM="Goniomonas sp, Strain m" /LENGTH=214 /DNA_ID=CAMNT_0001733627 /DNA_START=44 /DNA_END=685 /DNA_ORIENTATION=-
MQPNPLYATLCCITAVFYFAVLVATVHGFRTVDVRTPNKAGVSLEKVFSKRPLVLFLMVAGALFRVYELLVGAFYYTRDAGKSFPSSFEAAVLVMICSQEIAWICFFAAKNIALLHVAEIVVHISATDSDTRAMRIRMLRSGLFVFLVSLAVLLQLFNVIGCKNQSTGSMGPFGQQAIFYTNAVALGIVSFADLAIASTLRRAVDVLQLPHELW